MHYDQSFNLDSLGKTLRKSDFFENRNLHDENYKHQVIEAAILSAGNAFQGRSPLRAFHLKGKVGYRFVSLHDELVVRKLYENISRAIRIKQKSRNLIIKNLAHLLSEGVPYRVYRLDIKSFYESFERREILRKIDSLAVLSPLTKEILRVLLERHAAGGGSGLPRGLAISALLSNFMMVEFDEYLANSNEVFFSARYVDDIIIVTNAEECERGFIKEVRSKLPGGLALSESKRDVVTVGGRVSPAATRSLLAKFSYLGYDFSVYDPIRDRGIRPNQHFRQVVVDISEKKIKKIKTKIARSFLAFGRGGDFCLLSERIKYLTSNYSIKDYKKGGYKIVGIYYNYPQLTVYAAEGLSQLDRFLRDAIRSTSGRVFVSSGARFTGAQRRELLRYSFVRGFERKTFLHFHHRRIRRIEECWIHV